MFKIINLRPFDFTILVVSILTIVGLSTFSGLNFYNSTMPISWYSSDVYLIIAIFVTLIIVVIYFILKSIKQRRNISDQGAEELEIQLYGVSISNALISSLRVIIKLIKSERVGIKDGKSFTFPWFLVIGSVQSGKSTLIQNSGLLFPEDKSALNELTAQTEKEHLARWWFTDKAIFLELTGDNISKPEGNNYSNSWKIFWKKIISIRPEEPVNGLICAVTANQLFFSSNDQLLDLARRLRTQLNYFSTELKLSVPVYLFVTKCDLLPGFVELFGSKTDEELAQIWGITLPLDTLDNANFENFWNKSINDLYKRLHEFILIEISEHSDEELNKRIYGFLVNFSIVLEQFKKFTENSFKNLPYEPKINLRGIYFNSAYQNDEKINVIKKTTLVSLGLQTSIESKSNAAKVRSYFIKDLVLNRVIPDAGWISFNKKYFNKYLLISFSVFVFLILLAGLFLLNINTNNALKGFNGEELLFKDKIKINSERESDPITQLELMDSAERMFDSSNLIYSKENWSWLTRPFGSGELYRVAKNNYCKISQEIIFPKINQELITQLNKSEKDKIFNVYLTLRTYIMLNDLNKFEYDAMNQWFERNQINIWKSQNESIQLKMISHVKKTWSICYEENLDINLNKRKFISEELIKSARNLIEKESLAPLLYNNLIYNSEFKKFPEISVSSASTDYAIAALKRRSGQPLTRGVSGIYTFAGYLKFEEILNVEINKIIKYGWVFSTTQTLDNKDYLNQVKKAVMHLYVEDYIKNWKDLLADVAFANMTSQEQGSRIMSLLSDANSPYRRFVQTVALQTQLTKASSLDAKTPVSEMLVHSVNRQFSPLHNWVGLQPDGKFGANPPIDLWLKELSQIGFWLAQPEAFIGSADSVLKPLSNPLPAGMLGIWGSAGDSYVKKLFVDSSTQNLPNKKQVVIDVDSEKNMSFDRAKLSSIAKPLSIEPDNNFDVQNQINQLKNQKQNQDIIEFWREAVVPICVQSIAGRYPLSRNGNNEIPLRDFITFFGSEGVIDNYYQQHLSKIVTINKGEVKWLHGSKRNESVPSNVLQIIKQIQKAQYIKQAFFSQDYKTIAMDFLIQPSEKNLNIKSFSINYGKGNLNFDMTSGVNKSQMLSWSSNSPISESVMEIVLKNGNKSRVQVIGGWSGLKIFDDETLMTTDLKEVFKMNFRSDEVLNGQFSIKLTTSSIINPFRRELWNDFNCLSKFN